MRVSLFEARFTVDLMENDLATIIEALIYYGEKEMDGHMWIARERLRLAEDLRNSFAAELESRNRNYLGVQIQKRLEVLNG
jgi:hypothetical protein